MKILINLIGEQPSPNYFAIKIFNPTIIISVFTNLTEKVYNNLKLFFPNVRHIDVKVEGFNLKELNDKLFESLNLFKNQSNDLIFNITGGNKLMSLTAFDISMKLNSKSVYIDSQNQTYYLFQNREALSMPLIVQLSIVDYFKLHGIYNIEFDKHVDSDEEKRAKEDLNRFFTDRKKYQKSLKLTSNITNQLNKGLKLNNSNNVKIEQGENYFEWKDSKGKIFYKINKENISINIPTERILDYHNGKWYEDLIKKKLTDSGEFDEIISNLTIYADKKNKNNETVTVNELDIVAIKNGKLSIFECKTGLVSNNILEKLQSIKDLLGKFSEIKLITPYVLSENTKNEIVVKQKLKDLNIKYECIY